MRYQPAIKLGLRYYLGPALPTEAEAFTWLKRMGEIYSTRKGPVTFANTDYNRHNERGWVNGPHTFRR